MKTYQPIVESVGFVWSCGNIFFLWTCWGLLLLYTLRLRRGSYCWRDGKCVFFFLFEYCAGGTAYSCWIDAHELFISLSDLRRILFDIFTHYVQPIFSPILGWLYTARALSVYEWLIYMRRIWIFLLHY